MPSAYCAPRTRRRGLLFPTRSYVPSLRTEQAATTRRRILEAAAACFTENGYSGTSLADIGARAGVSPETVKNNGPKRELLLGAFEQAFAGTEGPAPPPIPPSSPHQRALDRVPGGGECGCTGGGRV